MIKFIKRVLSKAFRISYRKMMKNNTIIFPKKSKIKFNITGISNVVDISNDSLIKQGIIRIIGNNCKLVIGDKCFFENVQFWLENNNSQIIVGNNNKFCGNVDISAIEGGFVIFKDNCLVSRNVSIVNGDSHKIFDHTGKRINESMSITIGNHVWIGKNVSILKRGSIGDNCIVGANSLVTKDFSNNTKCVIAGSPAKVIKEKVDWVT